MDYKIIDFHTHPFLTNDQNICNHKAFIDMTPDTTRSKAEKLGIEKICGSVVQVPNEDQKKDIWGFIKGLNDTALKLRDYYKGFYIPGFHIHSDFVKESCEEIDRMKGEGVNLIGELVPYFWGYRKYNTTGMHEITEYATKNDMIISFHPIENDDIDGWVMAHPNTTFVAAHPGEYGDFMRHIERMKKHDNYYLDLSGYGVFREGMLRRAIDEVGADRILFGSDYPTCTMAMYVGSVILDELITDTEKEKILYLNAKRLLKL